MTLERLRRDAPTGDVVDCLSRAGAVILEELLEPATVMQLNEELDPFLDDQSHDPSWFVNPAVAQFFGPCTRNVTGLAAKSATFVHEVLHHPTFIALGDAVLGPNCARYQLNVAQVLDRGPGAVDQLLHRDEDVWIHVPRPHGELALASVVALEPFRTSNGATRVVAGSHRWDPEREPTPAKAVAAEMEAGSAVVYLGSTIHGGGPNMTADRRRRGMHLSYVVGWLRTEENHSLAVPPAVARTLPRCAQELLGYAVHDAIDALGGYLGVVELQDPMELLRTGAL